MKIRGDQMAKFRNLFTGFVAVSVLASSFLIVAPANARIVHIPPGVIHPGPNFPGNGGQFGGMHNPGMGGAIAAAAIGGLVIPPFLVGWISRIYAAIFSFWAGVMPPMPMLGRSLLYVQSHCVA